MPTPPTGGTGTAGNLTGDITSVGLATTLANIPALAGTNLTGTAAGLSIGGNAAGLTASTSNSIGVGSIELGAASDTTIARASAGKISVEGVNVVTISSTDSLSNKTVVSPVMSTGLTATGSTSNNFSGSTGTFQTSAGGTITPAGTTSVAPLTLTTGTNLTTPIAGAFEFDGAAFYQTIDTTSGRGQADVFQLYRTTSDGGGISTSIADYFPATSSLATVTNGVYLLYFDLFFLKTTNGTVTFTLTNTQTYTNLTAFAYGSNAGGIGTAATLQAVGIVTTTTAAAALPASVSLTGATEQRFIITATAECGTAGNIRLRATCSAGSLTQRRGSLYMARRLSAGNVGTFVA